METSSFNHKEAFEIENNYIVQLYQIEGQVHRRFLLPWTTKDMHDKDIANESLQTYGGYCNVYHRKYKENSDKEKPMSVEKFTFHLT